MLNTQTTRQYSTTAIESGVKTIDVLAEGTRELITCFEVLRTSAEEGHIPSDPAALEECEQMFITINRLIYQERSRIMHVREMQKAMEAATRVMQNARSSASSVNQMTM